MAVLATETSLSSAPTEPPTSLSVLIVDDDPSMRSALEVAVRSLGYRCRTAADGQDAWEMHQRERADIILSDWQMPRMDGIELCRRTRVSEGEGAYTYFIFMTSFSDKEHFLLGMEAGADDYHTKPVDIDELQARLVSAGRVIAVHRRLAEKNAVLRRDSQMSFRVARVDELTQVGNRRLLEEELKSLWARVSRYAHRHSLVICDIDHFKAYNDRFGHLAGDEALRRVAQEIRATLRASDGLYRYGGEEFVVLLPEQTLEDAARAAERIRAAVAAIRLRVHDAEVPITISCGVAELDLARDLSTEEWLRRADTGLYRAKERGRNRVETDPPIART